MVGSMAWEGAGLGSASLAASGGTRRSFRTGREATSRPVPHGEAMTYGASLGIGSEDLQRADIRYRKRMGIV